MHAAGPGCHAAVTRGCNTTVQLHAQHPQPQPKQPKPPTSYNPPPLAPQTTAIQPSPSTCAAATIPRSCNADSSTFHLCLHPALCLQATSYVSRRRLDAADFDPDAVDEEGLPLVYNEARIAAFWGKRPGELASRWTRFAAISGE